MTNELSKYETLCELVAEHLTDNKHRVSVQFQASPVTSVDGGTIKTANGALIEITPEAEGMKQLEILLHEIAHVKLHYNTLAYRDVDKRPAPGSLKVSAETLEKIGSIDHSQEQQADALAVKWLAYAEDHTPGAAYDELEGRLIALIDWFEIPEDLTPEYKAIYAAIYPKIIDQVRRREVMERGQK